MSFTDSGIGKKEYIVNSVFDLGSKQTVVDGVKRLIDNDFDGAA
ncbi:transposon-encoded TnpW family protein [Lachnoclostridium sp. MSJ-17]|nr:transposon-encoded TnpW family protein [Lachnoclostridium sp. MSJ-17]MBU5462876.1 transposon-encoded TnpW family protein [Lachnoclostridium sp. MSJ-17]